MPENSARTVGPLGDIADRLRLQTANMEACIRCGLCLSVCPTYKETQLEEESPRGRIAMARAITEGAVELTPDIGLHLDSCLLCDACSAICPSGFQMEPLGLVFREVLLERRRWRRAFVSVFLGVMARKRLLSFFARSAGVARRAGFGIARVTRAVRLTAVMRLASPVRRRSFVARGQQWERDWGTDDAGTAVLFNGCVMRVMFPQVHEAQVEVLTARGFVVSAPKDQGCCGAVQAHSGLLGDARRLARENIDGLKETNGVISVDAAGCASFMKDYGHLLAEDKAYADAADEFAGRVRETLELAASAPPPPMGPVPMDVTLQDPCHLVHTQGIREQPRALLTQVPGLRLTEMQEADVCCGSAGMYNILNTDMGSKLGSRKAANVVATGARAVLTANPGCHLQLMAHLEDRNVSVCHVLEVLARAQHAARAPDTG